MAGTINAASIETCIATERDRIAALSAEIATGEYRVSLPVLGTVTRNGLNAMIGSVDDDIALLEAWRSAIDQHAQTRVRALAGRTGTAGPAAGCLTSKSDARFSPPSRPTLMSADHRVA